MSAPISFPHATAPPPDLLDPQALARLRELDPDGRHGVLPRVMQTFENSLLRMQAQILDASLQDDAAAVGAVAHTLKSSSASVGALALSAFCAETERAVRTGHTDGLQARVAQLVAEADRVLAAVRAMLRS